MVTLNLSYNDLAAVICLAAHLANADGEITEDEINAIIKELTDQYDFEGENDLLNEYLKDGMSMEPMEAARLIAAFNPVAKQWTSNFFAKTVAADGELSDKEKSLYWEIQDRCGLPDNNVGKEEKEETFKIQGPDTFEDLAAVISLCIGMGQVDGKLDKVEFDAILEGLRAQYDFEGRNGLLHEYIDAADKMDVEEAIERVKRFGPGPKQFTADMLYITLASDGELHPDETKVYKHLMDVCGLPLFSGADKVK